MAGLDLSAQTALGRALRVPLRFAPTGLKSRIRTGPGRGMRLIPGTTVNGCWIGTFEREKQRALASALARGDAFYDIGAHVGFFTLLGAKLVGPAGRVVAIEPYPLNLAILRRHVEINRLHQVEVVAAAADAQEGTASFAAAGSTYMGHLSAKGDLDVQTVSVDGLIERGRPVPAVLKIDVEGAELGVLRGASKTLSTVGPMVLLATHGAGVHRACIEELQRHGYAVRSLDRRSVETTDELVATRPRA